MTIATAQLPEVAEVEGAVAAARTLLERARAGSPASIYRAVYAGGWRGDGVPPDEGAPEAPMDTRFIEAVTAGVGERLFGPHWTVDSVAGDRAILSRHGVRAVAPANELDRPPEVGRSVRVPMPAVSASRLPGFVHRVGGAPKPPLSRIYVHLRPDAARWLLASYGPELARRGVAYEMKALAHPGNYFRGDAGVVMVSSADVHRIAEHLASAAGPGRLAGSPVRLLLTEQVAPGVAIADQPDDQDPSGATSHGMWVTQVLQWAADRSDGHGRDGAEMVSRRLVALGRSPTSPWKRGSGQERSG